MGKTEDLIQSKIQQNKLEAAQVVHGEIFQNWREIYRQSLIREANSISTDLMAATRGATAAVQALQNEANVAHQQTQRQNRKNLMTVAATCIIFLFGCWALAQYLRVQIRDRTEELRNLNEMIAVQEKKAKLIWGSCIVGKKKEPCLKIRPVEPHTNELGEKFAIPEVQH